MAKRGSDEWKAKTSATSKGKRRSPKTEFKKGNVPWTKGQKGIHLSRGTEFTKGGCLRGQAARNWTASGSMRIRTYKGVRIRWIKVRDFGPAKDRWIPLARFWWQYHHGPVHVGSFVVHRDGDSLNDNPTNLMLMHRKNLFAWQRSIRPQMEAKRKTRAAQAQKLRWRIFRMKKTLRAKRRLDACDVCMHEPSACDRIQKGLSGRPGGSTLIGRREVKA